MSLREKAFATTFILAGLSALAMATAPTLAHQLATPPATQAVLDEQVLLAKSGGRGWSALARVSPDGRVVMRVRQDKQWKLLVNGQPMGPAGNLISTPLFSPDGRRLVFTVVRGNRTSLIVDGEERASWAGNQLMTWQAFDPGPPPARFSPDGETLAYTSYEPEGKQERCTTQILGQPPERESGEIVSVSGGKPCLALRSGSRDGDPWSLIVDGKRGPTLESWQNIYPPFAGFTFSPDGTRYAYVAAGEFMIPSLKVKDTYYSSKDAVPPGALAEGVPVIVAFEGATVIIDGQRSGAGFIPKGSLEFEAGKRAQQEKGKFVAWNYIFSEPVFSPDGSRVAFAEVEFKGTKGFSSAPEFSGRVYVDQKPGSAYTVRGGMGGPTLGDNEFPIILRGLHPAWAGVSAPVFSPDSQHMACVGHAEGQTVVVLDGAITARLPGTKNDFAELLTFSPDSRHLAFVTGSAKPAYWTGLDTHARRRVIVDGVAGREYDASSIECLVFSADSRHVGYIVYPHGGFTTKAVAVLDEKESRIYNVVYSKTFRFSGADRVSYVALDEERGFFRVTQTAR
jgi:hypothetical protein